MNNSPRVYDKAKYHDQSVEDFGLPAQHAANHTVFFLRWLIENGLMSDWFIEESSVVLGEYRAGAVSIHDVYEFWDECLIDDMLSDAGNAFAIQYFDFERGGYLKDYAEVLQGSLQSEFHVQYTEENFQKIRQVIDARYRKFLGTDA
jgi:hypothetical protein